MMILCTVAMFLYLEKKMWVFHGYMFVYQRVGGETSKIFMFTTKIGERM